MVVSTGLQKLQAELGQLELEAGAAAAALTAAEKASEVAEARVAAATEEATDAKRCLSD